MIIVLAFAFGAVVGVAVCAAVMEQEDDHHDQR